MTQHEVIPRSIVFPSEKERLEFFNQEDYNVDLSSGVTKFKNLFETATLESEIQVFLEKYPHFLPGYMDYHLGPAGRAVVTKLPLGNDYITDFAFLACNSMEVCLSAIEIENPTKKIFDKNGDFSRDYIQARQQVIDWIAWAEDNKEQAFKCFGKLGKTLWSSQLRKRFRAYLVIGDSDSFTSTKEQERWSAETQQESYGIIVMSYRRLLKMSSFAYIFYQKRLLMCSYKNRDLHVKYIAG
jgi:hypothetical protein